MRNSTKERYLPLLVNWILPKFRNMPINSIKRSDIKTFLLSLYQAENKTRSISTIELVNGILSNVFEQARDEDLTKHNPTNRILKRLKLERNKMTGTPLTLAEMNRVIDTCAEHYPEMYPFFMIAFYTGMRLGEIIPLEWDDIDLEKHEIKVNKSFRRELINDTKTGENRSVKITSILLTTLREYRLSCHTKRLFDNNGQYYSQNKIRNYLKQVLMIAGLKHVRFHDLRHTYASLMLSLGEPIHYVQNQLGHKNASMTLDRYGKYMPVNKEQGNALENAIKNMKNSE
ncbi:phage integrase [Candidatus Magnetomorum sp. HK-1]|nr:phage integrase [Candidatus Magnetomorum sp. HK-1]